MNKLVIVRHGESVWNKENIFTGWIDAPLSEKGILQAKQAGLLLKSEGYVFNEALTSVLQRAYKTLDIILEEMNLNIPVIKSWRLNERHYGALQGKHKDEMAKIYGEEQVFAWRRSYEVRPPEQLKEPHLEYPEIREGEVPLTESLEDTEKRVLPYWNGTIIPEIKKGKKLIISAHGNSIRAIVNIVNRNAGKSIERVNIPMGEPMVYEIDENMNFVNKYYLNKNISCNF